MRERAPVLGAESNHTTTLIRERSRRFPDSFLSQASRVRASEHELSRFVKSRKYYKYLQRQCSARALKGGKPASSGSQMVLHADWLIKVSSRNSLYNSRDPSRESYTPSRTSRFLDGRTQMENLFLLLLATSAHALMQSARVKRASQQAMKDDQLALTSERQQQQRPQDGPVTWRWISGDGRTKSWMDVLSHTHLAEQTRNNVEVHVACDSAVQGRFVVFATVVCVIAKGQAGRYFYSRLIEEKRQYPVLQTRLLREVQLSLDTAEALKLEDVTVAQVHCDSNTDPAAKSTEHTRMLTGYIQSMGCMSSAPQLHRLRRGALRTRNASLPTLALTRGCS